MSGHSKWHNIQAKKGKTDAQRGKIFTKIGREIAVAVKEGGSDIDTNNRLKIVVQKAKDNNMPNETIKNAIKKASGDTNSANYETIVYEGYGIGGSAVIVECLTDNKNRTASDVRHHFDKYGGSLGATGCVSYLFKRKGIILIEKTSKIDSDNLFMQALDSGAEDIIEDDESFEITTSTENFENVVKCLKDAGYILESKEISLVPNVYVELDKSQQETFDKMLDLLEESDDVQEIYHNVK